MATGEREQLRDGLTKFHLSRDLDLDEEQEIMTAMRVAGWDSKQIRCMTYTVWKDGIDIDRPSTALVAFARLIRSGLMKT